MNDSNPPGMALSRPAGMPCPECQIPIIVDTAALLAAQPISCAGCGLVLQVDREKSADTLQALSRYMQRMGELQDQVAQAHPAPPADPRGRRAPRRRPTRSRR